MSDAGERMIELAEGCTYIVLASLRNRGEKPGTAFLALPVQTQELLRELRSSDIADVRWPPWRE